ncbi:MAG: acyl carrier protein [Treponema sp.]|nr:acyl carrier protein [Treponema sp.]
MEVLKKEIKDVVISSLELEDLTADDIKDDEPLFGEGLGLDSIDALELGVALKKHFCVKFSSENEENKKRFASINTLAEYIAQEKDGQ